MIEVLCEFIYCFWRKARRTNAEDYAFIKRKVLTVKGRVIAIVCIYRLNAHPDNAVGIDWFAIDPKYWRRDLGTKLVKWAIAQAKAYKKNILFVWSIKRVIPFYEKLGFKRSDMSILRESKQTILLVKKIDVRT